MNKMIIGLKVEAYKSFAECAKIVPRFEPFGYSEIKNKIQNHDYVLCYACTDDIGVKKIIRCYEQLVQAGITVSLYELDHRPTTIEFVRNRDRMYDEIAEEIEAEELH